MPEMVITRNRLSIGVSSPEIKEMILSFDEQAALDIIFNELKANDCDVNIVNHYKTKEYLCLSTYEDYAFCRLKLQGRVKYMSLTVCGNDRKALNTDPRFSNLTFDGKRFFRIPISTVEDINLYTDLICPDYKWALIIDEDNE